MTSLHLLIMAAALSLPIDGAGKKACCDPRDCCGTQPQSGYTVYGPGVGGAYVVPAQAAAQGVYAYAPQDAAGGSYIVYAPDGKGPAAFYTTTGDDETSIATRIRAPKQQKQQRQDLPSTWIGVRMSPVPAPLAAHIGGDGMMVANVVKDSPADSAGLQQYDVITKFNDVKIVTNDDLVKAVQEAGRGTAKVRIIRSGKSEVVGIKPAKRPDSAEVSYKYDEAFDAVTNSNMQFRGHMLTPGQNGAWTLQDLGDLENLPQGLAPLFKKFEIGDGEFDLGSFGDGAGGMFMFRTDDGDGDGQVEIRVKSIKDGQTVVVERDADGRIGVTRTDENGKSSTESYENMEELRAADEDAANMIGGHGGLFFHGAGGAHGLGGPMRMKIQNLPKLRMQWQGQMDKALEDVREQLHNARIEIHHIRKGDDVTSESQAVAVRISDGGVIVTTTDDGDTVEHRFDSMDDLKLSDPDLYERVRSMLGDDGGM